MRGRIGNQRGAGTFGCLFLLALTGASIYAGLQFGLPYLRNKSFQERLNESFSYFSRQPEETIRNRIILTATEFDIDLKPEQVKVQIQGDRVTIDIDYEKVADLKYWKKTLPYHIHRMGPY